MKINKIADLINPFLVITSIFVISGLIFNTIETVYFYRYQEMVSFSTILKSYFNIVTVFCLFALFLFPLYLLLGCIHKKTAQIVSSVLFSLLISLEIGLFMYCKQTGALMGTELIIRPFSEIITTIQNSSDIFLDITLFLIVVSSFIVLPFLLKKIKLFHQKMFLITGTILVVLFSMGNIFYQRDKNQNINNYLETKSYYFFFSVVHYLTEKPEIEYFIVDEQGIQIEKNEELLKEYIELNHYQNLVDLDFPMERPISEFPDVLSSFIKKTEKQPNIVIIIVESLDRFFINNVERKISFTPFIDSLARTGLFWENCIATSARTYGVVPAVIGSVPHGMKGFQFGIMPKHHSLFSLLKNNDYATRFFYGGDPNFDSMLDFLTVQETEHIDNYWIQIQKLKKKKRANWWGVHDDFLFEESFNLLKTKEPSVNVYLTITTHEPFLREDTKLKEKYLPVSEEIFSKLDPAQQKNFLPIEEKLAVFYYLDDAVRNFINEYSKHSDFENTIFIITGDHSVGVHKNSLAYYTVPLIIWSPLLKTNRIFPNIVSHLSITPSLISFLHHNYHIDIPEKLSWCGNGLDTSSFFNPVEKTLILSYDRKVNKMVYNQYFFEDKTEWAEKKLFEITEDLDLKSVSDPKLIEDIHSKFKIYKYVNNYVYHDDKLITTQKNLGNEYKVIKKYENLQTIVCKTPDTVPSIKGINEYILMPVHKIKENYNKIKIKCMADVIINDFVYQDEQMELNFSVSGKDFQYSSKEAITKYITDDMIECGKKYSLVVEKEIDVKNVEDMATQISVTTNKYDKNWKPDKKVTISNVRVIIWGK